MIKEIPRLIKKSRIPLAVLALSIAGIQLIKDHEGFSSTAYPDPTHRWKVPTIGYGTTEGVKKGDVVTEQQATRMLIDHVNKNLSTFRRCTVVPLTQVEFDWYVDFYYNVGATSYCSSTLTKLLRKGDYLGAANQVTRWKFSNGVDCSKSSKCRGLWNRRLEMQAALLKEIKEVGP